MADKMRLRRVKRQPTQWLMVSSFGAGILRGRLLQAPERNGRALRGHADSGACVPLDKCESFLLSQSRICLGSMETRSRSASKYSTALSKAKFSVVQPLLRDFAGILPDELIHERLEPGGPTGGNLALDLFDVVLHRFLNEPGGSRTRDLRIKRSNRSIYADAGEVA